MPLLDVSSILTDPDFATRFDVIHSTLTIGDGGVGVRSSKTTRNIVGVVTANDDINLLRTEEGQRLAGSITVHTKFALTDGGRDYRGQTVDADVVVWKGRQYVVASIGDWSQFGAGFITAVCMLQQVSPA